jgi:hypothetical protein
MIRCARVPTPQAHPQYTWRQMANSKQPTSPHDPLSSGILYPHWQNEYAAAMVETNPQDLSRRVEAAEIAIYKRLQELLQDTDHHTERHVIEDARASLKILKKENPGLTDGAKE